MIPSEHIFIKNKQQNSCEAPGIWLAFSALYKYLLNQLRTNIANTICQLGTERGARKGAVSVVLTATL
jgi:hypothetical protein